MDDFYITLPSSVKNHQFDNTSSRYVTRLPQVLYLEKEKYLVAATDVIYPYSFVNVAKELNYWIHFKDRPPINVTFPTAQYSNIDDVLTVLNGRPRRKRNAPDMEEELERAKKFASEEMRLKRNVVENASLAIDQSVKHAQKNTETAQRLIDTTTRLFDEAAKRDTAKQQADQKYLDSHHKVLDEAAKAGTGASGVVTPPEDPKKTSEEKKNETPEEKKETTVADKKETPSEEKKKETTVGDKNKETPTEEKKKETTVADKKETPSEEKKKETTVADKKKETPTEEKKKETPVDNKKKETPTEEKKKETPEEEKEKQLEGQAIIDATLKFVQKTLDPHTTIRQEMIDQNTRVHSEKAVEQQNALDLHTTIQEENAKLTELNNEYRLLVSKVSENHKDEGLLKQLEKIREKMNIRMVASGNEFLHFEKKNDRIAIKFRMPDDVLFIEFEQSCAYFLGFHDTIVLESCTAPHNLDFFGNVSTLYLYCDIVDPIIVGDQKNDLLTVIPCKGKYGEMIHHTIPYPRYLPIRSTTVDSIKVELLSEFGEPIHFHWGSTILVLHFKKINQ